MATPANPNTSSNSNANNGNANQNLSSRENRDATSWVHFGMEQGLSSGRKGIDGQAKALKLFVQLLFSQEASSDSYSRCGKSWRFIYAIIRLGHVKELFIFSAAVTVEQQQQNQCRPQPWRISSDYRILKDCQTCWQSMVLWGDSMEHSMEQTTLIANCLAWQTTDGATLGFAEGWMFAHHYETVATERSTMWSSCSRCSCEDFSRWRWERYLDCHQLWRKGYAALKDLLKGSIKPTFWLA